MSETDTLAPVEEAISTQEYFINMGPQHPSTHGVLRLVLTIDGEIIRRIEPHIGYIHRSIEKMCEKDSYRQIVHLTDRLRADQELKKLDGFVATLQAATR